MRLLAILILFTSTLVFAQSPSPKKTPAPKIKDLLPRPEELPMETPKPEGAAGEISGDKTANPGTAQKVQIFATCKDLRGMEYKQGTPGYQTCVDEQHEQRVERRDDVRRKPPGKNKNDDAPAPGVGASYNFGK